MHPHILLGTLINLRYLESLGLIHGVFIMPMILAIIVSVVKRIASSLADKLKSDILNAMLWGGVILLVIGHVDLVKWFHGLHS